jgi:hypothetical protein
MSRFGNKKPEVSKKSDTSKAKLALRSNGHGEESSVDAQGGAES